YRVLGDTLRVDYARREIRLRGELRQIMNNALAAATNDPHARMSWTLAQFLRRIFLRYQLKLIGWPKGLVWQNLSNITGLARISLLIHLFKAGLMRFEPNTPAERDAARLDPCTAAPGPLFLPIPPKLGHVDIKARRLGTIKKWVAQGFKIRYVRNGPKSSKWISAAAEERAE
ncbi:hypothetical protein C8Q78DRAFT_948678, partial [Trametes maxima]